MKYRAEIDGLRALAVIPVILFHAGFELFSGGFVGVDVFFVISGYLITTILIEDIENKRFSIVNFYEKRARRILPALFFVMLACIPFAWMWMLPDPLENFGQSLVATTLSANNILLFLTSGYWDLASEFKPILHTWSLGIEEQFYILFPVFLIAIWHLGKGVVLLSITLLLIASLALSEWLSRGSPDAAFFLLHTRAWELFAGSLAAFTVQKNGVQKNDTLAILGLSAIIFSIFFYDESTPFPSVYALVPVLGVILLVLYAHKETLVAKLLSYKVFVGIGLVSYSMYLWHQPIFAFTKIYNKIEPGLLTNLVLITCTFFIAYFSWKYIEKPFRNKSIINGHTLIFTIFVASIFLVGFGYAAHKTHGFAFRVFDDSVSSSDMYISYNQRNFEFKKDAFQNKVSTKVLVIGNSFGRDFVNVLRETYDVSSFELIYRDDYDTCTLLKNEAGGILASTADIIIFASNYSLDAGQCNTDAIEFANSRNSQIFFVGTKQFGFNHNWIARTNMNQRELLRNPVLLETQNSDFNAAELIPAANYISIMQPLTNDDGVLVTDELGRLISPDRAHLTKYGAIYIGREIVRESALNILLANPKAYE